MKIALVEKHWKCSKKDKKPHETKVNKPNSGWKYKKKCIL